MFRNQSIETMPRAELEQLQSQRLSALAARVYAKVPFYKQKFDELGLEPETIKDVRDLTRLPFTRKTDLRDTYPFGLFAVPQHEVIRLHASSGTTGKPTLVGYTRDDLQMWAEVCARCLALAGARPGDVFQNAYGYGLFTGGLGMHYGAEALGLTVIPMSGGNTSRQIMFMQDLGTQVLACTPSYALALADALLEHGVDHARLKLRTLLLGAEPWTDGMRHEIENKLQADAVNVYGLSEIIGPGVSTEAVEEKNGSYIAEDHFLPEVIDPNTGERLPDGQVGELVFTTLTKQAFPLIRYRTGDLASLTHEPGVHGRTHARHSRIIGRADDMLIIRGVNVFPSQIESALMGIPDISPHHQIVVTREGHLDVLEVQVEITEEFFHRVGEEMFRASPIAGVTEVHQLQAMLNTRLHEALGLHLKITLLPPGKAPRSEGGKLRRVVDKRVM